MDKSSFQRLLRRTVALPIVLLGLLAVTLLVEVISLTSSLRWVEHSDQVMSEARQSMRAMLDMESSVRGFELTGDPSFLQTFESAKRHLPASLDDLVQLTADNPLQQSRLKDIRDLDKGWIEWAQQEISERKYKQPAEAELMFGDRLMDEIRARQRDVQAEEERLLLLRSHRASLLGRALVMTAGGLSLLIVAVLIGVTRRELRDLTTTYEDHLTSEAERTRQLEESRQWFQTTLNSIGEAVVATDSSGNISYINAVALRLAGWDDAGEALNRPLGEVVRILEEDSRTELWNPLDLAHRSAKIGGLSDHVALVDRTGREFPVELTASPILAGKGQLAGVVIVFRDITQRLQTEQTLRVSERLNLAGRLSATIAHEIRNPLDTVTNLVYLLQQNGSDGEVNKQYLQMASDELARITQITGQLLTFHREARHPIHVNVCEVLESVLTLFAPQIRRSEVQVEKRFETGDSIRGFPGELRQVFSNLIGNALEAMPKGGRLLLHARNSSLATDPGRKGVRVTIIDTGSGITSGVKKNLFAPFFTTKGERGTGLGLWVSRGIIEKHEGTIHVAGIARSGSSGTAFSVFLPFHQVLGKLEPVRSAPAHS